MSLSTCLKKIKLPKVEVAEVRAEVAKAGGNEIKGVEAYIANLLDDLSSARGQLVDQGFEVDAPSGKVVGVKAEKSGTQVKPKESSLIKEINNIDGLDEVYAEMGSADQKRITDAIVEATGLGDMVGKTIKGVVLSNDTSDGISAIAFPMLNVIGVNQTILDNLDDPATVIALAHEYIHMIDVNRADKKYHSATGREFNEGGSIYEEIIAEQNGVEKFLKAEYGEEEYFGYSFDFSNPTEVSSELFAQLGALLLTHPEMKGVFPNGAAFLEKTISRIGSENASKTKAAPQKAVESEAQSSKDVGEKPPKPAKQFTVGNQKAIELAKKTAIAKFRGTAKEIKRKIRAGDHTLVEVSVFTPSGAKTKFSFTATEDGLNAVKKLAAAWKRKPAATLALDPPLDISSLFDAPMPNWKPFRRSLSSPTRPGDGAIDVAGEIVTLPPEHKPVRRDRIRLAVEKVIGTRVYQGKVKGKTRLGFYRRENSEVRVKNFNDIETMAHELAHWLDFHSTNGGRFTTMRKKAPKKARTQMENLSYSSQSTLVNKEGFAEFVRLWLTQYEVAKKTAPDFLKLFEVELANNKKLQKGMTHLRREMHKYFLQGPLAQARSKQGVGESMAEKTERFLADRPAEMFRQQAVDSLHGFRVLEREVSGGIASAEKSPFKLFQMVNGSEAVYESAFHYGALRLEKDGSFAVAGKSLKEILKPVTSKGALAFDDFLQYAAGRRAQELKTQDRENLFTTDEIDAMLSLERPGFSDVFEGYQAFNQTMLQFYVDMGLLTKDQKKAFTKANQNYFPFHRVQESLDSNQPGTGIDITKRLRGGDHNVRDLGENMVMGIASNVRAAMIARAKREMYSMVSKSQSGSAFAVQLSPDSRLVKDHVDGMADRVAATMAAMGFGVSSNGQIVSRGTSGRITDTSEVKAALLENPELLDVWQHNIPPSTKGTIVDSAVIDGKRQYFEVIDPVLANSLLSLRLERPGWILRGGLAVRRLITRSITNMVQFITPNIARDTVTAAAVSDSKFRPLYDSIKGLGNVVVRSETYKDWHRQGGGYASLVHAVTASGRNRAQLEIPAHGPLDYLAKALAGYDTISSASEDATRVGEYQRALDMGLSKTEAAYRAREVSSDFSKKPGNRNWANLLAVIPFANAALVGNDRLVKAFTGEDGRIMKGRMAHYAAKRAFFSVGTALSVFTVLLWLVNKDDERYQKLTPDQKARFWHIWFPGQKQALQIPKPYGIGFVFADIPENVLDHVFDVEGADFAENLAWSFAHHFWFLDYPGAIQPMMDHMANEKFTGAPIIPPSLDDASLPMQFTERTPEIYKWLGRKMDISPILAQHYTKGYMGYVEMMFADTTELMLWDKEAFGPRPFPRKVSDYFLKQFHSGKVSYRSKYTNGYYELRSRAASAAADIRIATAAMQRGDMRYQNVVTSEMNQTLAAVQTHMRKIDKILAAGSDAMIAVTFDPSLTREEKETQIETWYSQKDEFMAETLKSLEAALKTVERGLEGKEEETR